MEKKNQRSSFPTSNFYFIAESYVLSLHLNLWNRAFTIHFWQFHGRISIEVESGGSKTFTQMLAPFLSRHRAGICYLPFVPRWPVNTTTQRIQQKHQCISSLSHFEEDWQLFLLLEGKLEGNLATMKLHAMLWEIQGEPQRVPWGGEGERPRDEDRKRQRQKCQVDTITLPSVRPQICWSTDTCRLMCLDPRYSVIV